jgi:hypothetical protein
VLLTVFLGSCMGARLQLLLTIPPPPPYITVNIPDVFVILRNFFSFWYLA